MKSSFGRFLNSNSKLFTALIGATGVVLSFLEFGLYVAIILTLIILTVVLLSYLFYMLSGKSKIRLKVVENFSGAPAHFVFVYGSLLVKESVLRTISQPTEEIECIPATLSGYKLSWVKTDIKRFLLSASGNRLDQRKGIWASLAITKASYRKKVNGCVIALSHSNYLALLVREKNYALADVSNKVEPVNHSSDVKRNIIEVFAPKDKSSMVSGSSANPILIRKTGR